MFKIILYLFLFVTVCYSDKIYKKNYKYVKDLKAYYKIHKVKSTFSNAIATCKAESSKLLIPLSKQEVDEVVKLSPTDIDLLWIGLHDIYVEGEFMALYNTPMENVYVKWAEGEPLNVQYQNNSYDEDCITLDRNGTYNDVPCHYPYSFVCKKEDKDIVLNQECETYEKGYEYIYELDRCYKFINSSSSWHEAFQVCQADESYLAIPNSKNEVDVLTDLLSNYPEKNTAAGYTTKYIHVGFNDLVLRGEFLTINGVDLSNSGYEEWESENPYKKEESERCGAMKRDGLLSIVDCNIKAMFICEKELSGYST